MMENRKKGYKKIEEDFTQSPSKRWFRNGIHSLLKRADARGSADIIYRM